MYKPVKYNVTFKDSLEATYIVDNDCPVRVRGCRENDLTHTTVDKVSMGLKKGLLCEAYYSNEWRAIATAEECLISIDDRFIITIKMDVIPSKQSLLLLIADVIEHKLNEIGNNVKVIVEKFP